MSPSVQKNGSNFNSYVQNKYKITDPDIKKQLWSFASSINNNCHKLKCLGLCKQFGKGFTFHCHTLL